MNLANSSEIQLGEETNWNCCVCWWRGGERGRRWVDRRGKEDPPPLLHPTPPNASPALVESPALPAGEAAAAGTKSILGLRDSAAACEPAPALWAPTWGWHLAPGQPSGPNVGLARSRRTDHALTVQPTQGKCRTGANCFFLEATRGRSRSVRLAQ